MKGNIYTAKILITLFLFVKNVDMLENKKTIYEKIIANSKEKKTDKPGYWEKSKM